jgi:5'-3' exonuclease
MPKKLLLVDSNALFFRSRSALTRAMGEVVTSYGAPVTGTFGFLNALFSLMETHQFDCVVPVYDRGGNWRKVENDEYKATREKTSDSHRADMSMLIEDVLPVLGFTPVGVQGFEADDVIATISRNAPAFEEIYIFTCDKDLLALVTDRVKVILFNSAKKVQIVDVAGVVEMFGVPPSEVKLFKAIAGDSSDNIAGIKGLGPKTAVKIIEECRPIVEDSGEQPFFSTADRITRHPKVRDNAGIFLANLRLTTLENDVPGVVWFASSPPTPEAVQGVLTALEFKSMLKRLPKILRTLGVNNEV